MSLFRMLIRLLLIASLILNGSGHASAVMGATPPVEAHERMDTGAATRVRMAPDQATPPCHEMATETGNAMTPADLPASPDEAADCCDAGGCLHACHQQPTPAAYAVAFVPSARLQGERAIRSLATAHEGPAPHPLIRPPIA